MGAREWSFLLVVLSVHGFVLVSISVASYALLVQRFGDARWALRSTGLVVFSYTVSAVVGSMLLMLAASIWPR